MTEIGDASAQPPGALPAFRAAPTWCPWEAVPTDWFREQLAGVSLGQLPRRREKGGGGGGCGLFREVPGTLGIFFMLGGGGGGGGVC